MTDNYEVDSSKQVSVVANITNIKILDVLSTEQLNISELAVRLGISTAVANQHMKQLEEAGLVTRMGDDGEGGRDRQRYAAVANRFHSSPSRSLNEADRIRSIANWRRSFEEALQKWELSATARSHTKPSGKHGIISLKVSPVRYRELLDKIAQLMNEFISEEEYSGDDAAEAVLLCIFFLSQS